MIKIFFLFCALMLIIGTEGCTKFPHSGRYMSMIANDDDELRALNAMDTIAMAYSDVTYLTHHSLKVAVDTMAHKDALDRMDSALDYRLILDSNRIYREKEAKIEALQKILPRIAQIYRYIMSIPQSRPSIGTTSIP